MRGPSDEQNRPGHERLNFVHKRRRVKWHQQVKKPSLADEALSELKAEQPEIKEENLDKEEEPLELSEEATEEENKS